MPDHLSSYPRMHPHRHGLAFHVRKQCDLSSSPHSRTHQAISAFLCRCVGYLSTGQRRLPHFQISIGLRYFQHMDPVRGSPWTVRRTRDCTCKGRVWWTFSWRIRCAVRAPRKEQPPQGEVDLPDIFVALLWPTSKRVKHLISSLLGSYVLLDRNSLTLEFLLVDFSIWNFDL
jgi:hypothetical protein